MDTLKIIKIGGNIIDDNQALSSFINEFAKLEGLKILVHGGGKQATQMAKAIGVPVKMNQGRRITDEDTLDIITMVYAGKINKNIVAQLQGNSCNALGLTGADGNSIISIKRPVKNIDYGYVGDIQHINAITLKGLLNINIVPVFCALTHDGNGQLLNTNADTIAAELAIAFSRDYQTELYYCFEKNGVLADISDPQSVIENINTKIYKGLIDDGIISEGMLPKLNNCFHAINQNVHKICIGNPKMLFENNTLYTTIQK